jgi:ABC-2 type transport system ATP-binding protein
VAIIHHGALVAHGTVDELARGGKLRIAVKVAGDDQAHWIARLPRGTDGLPAGATVEGITDGAATIALARGEDAQVILDLARRAGPVEQFGFVRRRLSEVFRDAVGPDVQGAQAQTRPATVAAAAGEANPATEGAR